MRLLDEVTGQRAAIERVLELQTSPRKECVIISGPTGCGISWTLAQIGVEWDRCGGTALKAAGAAITPPRALLPWLTMQSPGRGTLARWEILKGGAVEASKAIPVVGEAAGYLVGELLNYRRKKLASQTQMLGDKEQDLLFVIETAAAGKRLLLAIDQLSSWDDDSWALLDIISSPLLDEFYPSLANALIIIGASDDALSRGRLLGEKLPSFEIRLDRLKRDELGTALRAFSFPQLDDQEMSLLYEATGGRLDLLHDFSALSRDVGSSNLRGDGSVLYGRMIERRLRTLKGNIAALEGLLSAGSFLGPSFSREEASCLTGYGMNELQAILRQAEQERLLGSNGNYVSFPSVAMQQYFLSTRLSDPKVYHAKFSDCLRRLRSGDYEARTHHLLRAGQLDQALVCYCLGALDARRRRHARPDSVQFQAADEWKEFSAYLASMDEAYSALDDDSLEDGLVVLQSIEAILPEPLIAERDYLEAQFRLKSFHIADFERAVVVLKRWLILQDVEPEIWSRIAQTLLIALTETNHREEAGELEEALTRYYGTRRTLDPWALYSLNCLRRRSECLHQLIPARNRLESALAYFGPATPGTLPRHPLQYYYTLTNLVSNLIASGSFAEATVRGTELQLLVQANAAYHWPALEIAANNSILAGYLAGSIPLVSATKLMRLIDEQKEGLGDRMLIRNNLAVLLIHGGELTRAQEILSAAYDQLGDRTESDGYHGYLIANNLAGLLALAGDIGRATQVLEDAGANLQTILPSVRGALARRHTLMPEALAAASKITAAQFDRFFADNHAPQVGPQWAFFGRGFLFSDIQFWALE